MILSADLVVRCNLDLKYFVDEPNHALMEEHDRLSNAGIIAQPKIISVTCVHSLVHVVMI